MQFLSSRLYGTGTGPGQSNKYIFHTWSCFHKVVIAADARRRSSHVATLSCRRVGVCSNTIRERHTVEAASIYDIYAHVYVLTYIRPAHAYIYDIIGLLYIVKIYGASYMNYMLNLVIYWSEIYLEDYCLELGSMMIIFYYFINYTFNKLKSMVFLGNIPL